MLNTVLCARLLSLSTSNFARKIKVVPNMLRINESPFLNDHHKKKK